MNIVDGLGSGLCAIDTHAHDRNLERLEALQAAALTLQHMAQRLREHAESLGTSAGRVYWRMPNEDRPPLGVKLLLLNSGGVCVVGTWGDWAVAWAPLPTLKAEHEH